MAEPKVQLVAPIGNINVPGMNVTGVVTATYGNVGVAGSIIQGNNIDIGAGIITATSFVGDQIGTYRAASLTGSPDLVIGVVTASSYVGDTTGAATSIMQGTNINAGTFNATTFVGNVTGNITGDVIGNASGIGASIKQGNNLNVGIATAVEWYGDGSGLTGAGSSAYIAQEVTATGAETIIDLSYGNLIYYKGEADTTVGFASTSAAEQLTFIRDTDSSYSISYSTGAVDFDGTDHLSAGSSSDFTMGTGDFTIECWVKVDTVNKGIWQISNTSGGLDAGTKIMALAAYSAGGGNNTWEIAKASGSVFSTEKWSLGQWYHTAFVRQSGVSKLYINGTEVISQTDTTDYGGTYIAIGGYHDTDYLFDGLISNFRIVKGTAVYTSNFVPPSAALTNVTNTKFLCCQSDSSTTTAAVTPGTITANGDPTAGAQTVSLSGSLNATITWPERVKWNNDTTPTLVENPRSTAAQVFRFTTVDTGLNYNAWEEIKNDNQTFGIWSWGTNNQGQLGQNQPTSSDLSSPTQVGSAPGVWDRVHSARRQTVAIKDNGTMWTVGYNISGSMGLNQPSTTKISSPTQLGTETTWSEIQSTTSVTLATKTDGTLWTWGTNYHGELGQNDGSYPGGDRSSPVQIPGTTWSDNLGRGKWDSFAIKTDGTLWGWGRNYYGTLGQNSVHQPGNVGLSSPTQIPGTTWEVISGGDENVLAKKTDGTLWAWGQNENGTLGLNNNDVSRSSPTQVGTETTWNSICAGLTNLATKTDGTLWVWGANEYGQLGINAPAAYVGYSSPTQIGTGTTWSGLVAIKEDMFATKTDGTLWSWGNNGDGELGLNDVTSRSSPTQIPGTDWNTIHGEQTGDPTRGDNISWLRAF